MPNVVFAHEGLEVEAPAKSTLMEIVAASGADLTFGCRSGTCGTCRIRVVAGGENLSPKTAKEASFLSLLGADDDARLACQVTVLGNAVVTTG